MRGGAEKRGGGSVSLGSLPTLAFAADPTLQPDVLLLTFDITEDPSRRKNATVGKIQISYTEMNFGNIHVSS